MINTLHYTINNGMELRICQRQHDGSALVYRVDANGDPVSDEKPDHVAFIQPGDMVMLINYYQHIKGNDIQHDFINPHGKNKEV